MRVQQQGESCWLYVLEAVGKAHGLSTAALTIAMHAYPDREVVARRSQPGSGLEGKPVKHVEVQLMAENLEDMILGLKDWRFHPESPVKWIHRDDFSRLAQHTLDSTSCVGLIDFDRISECADMDDLIYIFEKAHRRATLLLDIITSGNEVQGALLGGSLTRINPGDHRGAEHALKSLRSNSKMPVYITVRARYTMPEGAVSLPSRVDWTGRRDAMHAVSHSLLVTDYDKDRKIVFYKDPYYGDREIRITTEQFTRMAGDGSVWMMPYSASRGGELKYLAD